TIANALVRRAPKLAVVDREIAQDGAIDRVDAHLFRPRVGRISAYRQQRRRRCDDQAASNRWHRSGSLSKARDCLGYLPPVAPFALRQLLNSSLACFEQPLRQRALAAPVQPALQP